MFSPFSNYYITTPIRPRWRLNTQKYTISNEASLCQTTTSQLSSIEASSQFLLTQNRHKLSARRIIGRSGYVRILISLDSSILTLLLSQGEWGPFFNAHFHPNTHECYGSSLGTLVSLGKSVSEITFAFSNYTGRIEISAWPREARNIHRRR